MVILSGKGASDGIEMGRILFYRKEDFRIEKAYIENSAEEILRFRQAKKVAAEELQMLHQLAEQGAESSVAELFTVHQMVLEDEELVGLVEETIEKEHVSAEYAIQCAEEHFTRLFGKLEDEYMQARAMDVQDITVRLLGILKEETAPEGELTLDDSVLFSEVLWEDKVIVAAKDLLPSETVRLNKNQVLGFATQYGSLYSHTAILARNQGIPAVVNLGEEFSESYDGVSAIIDGTDGKIYIDPDEKTIEELKVKRHLLEEEEERLWSLKGKEDITLKGQKIDVYANIGSVQDIVRVKANDARGIGLFRSECLYLERADLPTEEEQFEVYKLVAEEMEGKPVIIRTMDMGADKQVEYLQSGDEENPALGYRAIRICLSRPELFKTQLRAICRASAYGQVGVMFPMITSVKEVKQIKEILAEVQGQLMREELPYDEQMEIGIMIETPAAVMISRELAKEVDFFSVGTNDLTQYTLAADRRNPKVGAIYDIHHPAVLAMIQMAVDNAHAEGKRIGICGELAADLEMTETFVRMGINELSVAPSKVLSVRRKVRESN